MFPKPGQDVKTCHAGISDAADQAQENADQFERDAQGVVDDIEEVFDDAADQAAEQLNNAADQVQSAAQGAADIAANFANSLQSELAIRCHELQHMVVFSESAVLQVSGFYSILSICQCHVSGSDVAQHGPGTACRPFQGCRCGRTMPCCLQLLLFVSGFLHH